MATPSAVLNQGVFAVSPAKAEPLLFAADVNAYNTSDRPCSPGLKMEVFRTSARTAGIAKLSAVPAKASVGVIRM